MDSLVKSINRFALDFSKKIAESAEGKNIFFSPWGISTSLAMVYFGTQGTTAAQIAQVSRGDHPLWPSNQMLSLTLIICLLKSK